MTEFQKRILKFVKQSPNAMASCWTIAQLEFPEKWKNKSGRGAVIGHIDRRGSAIEGMIRLTPRDRYDSAVLAWTLKEVHNDR